MFSTEDENNMYINDYVHDFEFECEQAELENANNTQVLLSGDEVKKIAVQDGVPQEKSHAEEAVAVLEKTHYEVDLNVSKGE